jgi:hypothetical protein
VLAKQHLEGFQVSGRKAFQEVHPALSVPYYWLFEALVTRTYPKMKRLRSKRLRSKRLRSKRLRSKRLRGGDVTPWNEFKFARECTLVVCEKRQCQRPKGEVS